MRAIPMALIGLTIAGLAGCSRRNASAPDDTAQARREILALQDQYRHAVRSKDVNAAAALMTPDFTLVKNGTAVPREKLLAQMRKTIDGLDSIEDWTMDLQDFEVEGNTAKGVVRDRMSAMINVPPRGVAPITVTSVSRTVWERTPSGWRYKRTTESSYAEKSGGEALGGLSYVSVKQWEENARKERQAWAAEQDRKTAKTVKATPKAPPGMTPQQARQLLTDLYARYRQAVRRKDAAAALALLTDDYTVTQNNTAIPRWEVEKGMRQDFARTRSIDRWDMAIQDVAAHGDTMVVVLKENRSAMVTGSDGRPRRVNTQDRMRDTWVKTNDGWKTQKTEVIAD